MKHLTLLLSCFFLMMTMLHGQEEFYHYVDDQGVKHFTENYGDIPEKYRSQTKIRKSIQSTDDTGPIKTQEATPSISLSELEQQRRQLDIEYQALLDRRNSLNLQKETMGIEAYNVQAKRLNDDIRTYQGKKDAFDQQVEAYNQQVNKPSPPEPDNPSE